MRVYRKPGLVRLGSLAVLPVLILLLSPVGAGAHPGGSAYGRTLWAAWNWEPLVVVNLAVLAALYGLGIGRLWRRAGRRSAVSPWQAAAFGSSVLVLLIALLSPLDVVSNDLASVHMVQHMVLVMLAAPLFVLGSPGVTILSALPPSWRRAIRCWPRRFGLFILLWRTSWSSGVAWTAHAVTLWVWHLPELYGAALNNAFVHDLQHLTFFITACLFWRVVIDPSSRLRLNPGLGVLYLFTTSLQATLLGVFMALSPRLWYTDYAGTTERWGLTPLEDQQLAGLIMWMPACAGYTIAAATVFALWLRMLGRLEVEDRRRNPHGRSLRPREPANLVAGLRSGK